MAHVATVTIDNTKVTADQTDFPVYVDLSDLPSSFWDSVANGGGDIRVYKDDDTTQLPREVVSCDTSDDSGQMHVKFTGTLSSSTDTDIHIYTDGTSSEPASDSTYGSENVWTNSYAAVWHLNNDPSTANSILDSTSNGYTLDPDSGMDSGNLVAGKMGDCLEFDGTSDDAVSTASGLYNVPTNGAFTCSAWINSDYNVTTSKAAFTFSGTDDLGLYPNDRGTGGARIFWRDLGGNIIDESDVARDGTWYYYTFTNSAGTAQDLQINGVSKGTASASDSGAGPFDSFYLGSLAGSQLFDGKLDEVRIATTERSDTWIDTEYNNQNDTSTFYTATAAAASGTSIKSIGGLAQADIKSMAGLIIE